MKGLGIVAISMMVALFAGCASIVSGTTQNIAVVPMKGGTIDVDSTCTASNQKGQWITNGGGVVIVKKSRDDLSVKCVNSKTNEVAVQSAPRSTQVGWAVANFFLWDFCTISCLIDFSSGAIYEYPTQVQLYMPN